MKTRTKFGMKRTPNKYINSDPTQCGVRNVWWIFRGREEKGGKAPIRNPKYVRRVMGWALRRQFSEPSMGGGASAMVGVCG
jgi:hypothetical protein